MSAHILCCDGDRCKHITRKRADRKVLTGRYRWRNRFEIEALPASIPSASLKLTRPFRYGPAASFNDWSPRMSYNVIVMQLRTPRALTP